MNQMLEQDTTSAEYISIGEAAERTGVTQRTLRYYEEIGLLKPAGRVARGQRLYSSDDLARVEHILRMKELLGFSLSEIKAAVEAEEAKQLLRADYKRERSARRKLKQLQEAAGITTRQIQTIDEKIVQMRTMREQLARDLASLNERIARIQADAERQA